MPSFVHLHVHSDYSILEGGCRVTLDKSLKSNPMAPPTLAKHAAKMGYTSIALTDRNVMYGVIDFYKSCKDAGIRPIIGCELNVLSSTPAKGKTAAPAWHPLLLLARDAEGYRNLTDLSSRACTMDPDKPVAVEFDFLARHTGGLIASSSCRKGEIASAYFLHGEAQARDRIKKLAGIFAPNDFYLELQDHGLDEEKMLNRFYISESKKSGIPCVATNDVHYLRMEDHEAHDILLCVSQNKPLADEKRYRLPSQEYYLKSAEAMVDLFLECPEALVNTSAIAERCHVEIELGKNKFPDFPLEAGRSREDYLRQLCVEGLARRYPIQLSAEGSADESKMLWERLEYELSVIHKTGFSSYFLIVWDFILYAKQQGIPVGPGRGSAAGSLIAYVLGITDVDPIKYGLLFERFLNPERVSPPDVDVDFCINGRAQVIDYVRKKYGPECVTQIVTYGTMGAKASIRDVTRVLGISYSEGDRLCKLIPNRPMGLTIYDAIYGKASDEKGEGGSPPVPELQAAIVGDGDDRRILELGMSIEGYMRSTGIHAAGVVICDRPVQDFVPVARAKEGEMVTQYDLGGVGDVGLLKMDFLGLKNLTVIQEALEMIQANTGRSISLEEIPMDDPKTLGLINEGKTIGMFQIESDGMRQLCRNFQVSSIFDIIALIALYRPGPMELIPAYIQCKKGERDILYVHPLLEKSTAETCGMMIYQEQVMLAAQLLAGYSLGSADMLRRAMGKKDAEKMAKERARFVEGCAAVNGISAKDASDIFDKIEKFAGYGFNKSHSAAYGVISYYTAWLKANYPVEYMAALMSNDIGDVDKIAVFCRECAGLGVQVLPPSVNHSYTRFSTEGGAIRFGLASIRGGGEVAFDYLVQERTANGSFKDIYDLCKRCDPRYIKRKELELLAKTGAFDEINPNRAQVFHSIDHALASALSAHQDARSGQSSLFGDDILEEKDPGLQSESNSVTDWSFMEKLQFEKELLGTFVSGHPMDEKAREFGAFDLTPISKIMTLPHLTPVRLDGMLTAVRAQVFNEKRTILKAVLENRDSSVELFVAPADFERIGPQFHNGELVLVCGVVEVSEKQRATTVRVTEVTPVEKAFYLHAQRVYLLAGTGADRAPVSEIMELVNRFSGRCPFFLVVQSGEHRVCIEPNNALGIRACPDFDQAASSLLGADSVKWITERNPPIPEPKRPRWANRKNNSDEA